MPWINVLLCAHQCEIAFICTGFNDFAFELVEKLIKWTTEKVKFTPNYTYDELLSATVARCSRVCNATWGAIAYR